MLVTTVKCNLDAWRSNIEGKSGSDFVAGCGYLCEFARDVNFRQIVYLCPNPTDLQAISVQLKTAAAFAQHLIDRTDLAEAQIAEVHDHLTRVTQRADLIENRAKRIRDRSLKRMHDCCRDELATTIPVGLAP